MKESDLEMPSSSDMSSHTSGQKSAVTSPRTLNTHQILRSREEQEQSDFDDIEDSILEPSEPVLLARRPRPDHKLTQEELEKQTPLAEATACLDYFKQKLSQRLSAYPNKLEKGLTHSKHILAKTYCEALPHLDIKAFILCTFWLQVPYEEGEFKEALEEIVFELANIEIDDGDDSGRTGKLDYKHTYKYFLETNNDPDNRLSILIEKLKYQYPSIFNYSSKTENQKSDIMAMLTDFIKLCVLDKKYKVSIAANNLPVGQWLLNKVPSISLQCTTYVNSIQKQIRFALQFFILITSDIPLTSLREALDKFYRQIQKTPEVRSSQLARIYAMTSDIDFDMRESPNAKL